MNVQTSQVGQTKLFIANMAYALMVLGLLMLVIFNEEVFVSGFFSLPGFLLFLFGVPVFLLLASRVEEKSVFPIKLMFLAYLFGITSLLPILFPDMFPRYVLLEAPVIATILLLLFDIIPFRSKVRTDRLLSIKFMFLLTIVLAFLLPTSLSFTLPYVYTPPALTHENLRVYNTCIRSIKNGDDCKSMAEQFHTVGSNGFQIDSNMVLFYGNANHVLPRLGVIYSLSGKNPNEIDSTILNPLKPFAKVGGNWYMSRHLTLRGPRTDIPYALPGSLIDRSLYLDGIDPNEIAALRSQ